MSREDKIKKLRNDIGGAINPIFQTVNSVVAGVRDVLDLEPEVEDQVQAAYGDVISVHRLGFEHYAVYVGENEVIHYDIDPNDDYRICVHQASIKEFLNGSLVYYICSFPPVYGRPTEEMTFEDFEAVMDNPDDARSLWEALKAADYHLYTPEETVERAKERIGETSYDLFFNNCEHFALWCKTGISESHQIEDVINTLYQTHMRIREEIMLLGDKIQENIQQAVEDKKRTLLELGRGEKDDEKISWGDASDSAPAQLEDKKED